MTKARTLADFISDGSPLADGTISVSEVSGAAPLDNPTFTGTASGTFSGPLTGNVTGDVTGDVTGNLTGNVTGAITGDVTASEIDLSAISSTISDTAVDVFVYDTSKDSDGGAWRKRTQGTSWYNETLNTATRGSRKEFPAVAVIVAESNQVTIYDGDDPDLPMWMVFNRTANYYPGLGFIQFFTGGGNGDAAPTALYAYNGIIGVTTTTGYFANGGVYQIRFITDSGTKTSTGGTSITAANISERNTAAKLVSAGTISTQGIVDGNCNDIAMTVLPNAPIDAATGLPVPTIAVATNGGVSVIKDDGTVVDHTDAGGNYHAAYTVAFDDDNYLWIGASTWVGQGSRAIYKRPLSSTDRTINITTDRYFTSHSNPGLQIFESTAPQPIVVMNEGMAFASKGSTNPLYIVQDNPTDGTISSQEQSSLIAFVTSDYNTGYQVGSGATNNGCVLATLSDTDDTDVTGSELVTNGTFDSDISGWTASDAGCSLSLVSNQLRITNNDSTAGGAVTSFSVVSGKVYTFSVGTSSGSVQIFLGVSPNTGTYFGPVTSNSITWTSTVTGTVYFMVKNLSTTNGATIDIDNISVRLAEEDRSVNGNGLQVFGTVTKNPVATGADLVAYSGFSTSNYLEQPYNSDLDFGTDFCYNIWAYKTSDTTENSIVSRGQNGSTNGFFYLGTNGSGQIYGYVGPSQINTLITAPSNVWNMYTVSRSSGVVTFYLNGNKIFTLNNGNSLANSAAKLYIGTSSYGVNIPYNGSLALARASATAPSPEQIKKIYEDEKVLFQENAQATLYGSSDAVTALAYDDTTELLHVGTSAGRSDFQGLRRVNNTTNAVGAAISASNGMIVEE